MMEGFGVRSLKGERWLNEFDEMGFEILGDCVCNAWSGIV